MRYGRPAAPAGSINCVAGTYASEGFHQLRLAQALYLLAPVIHRLVVRKVVPFFVNKLIRGNSISNRLAVKFAV
jgi:hypothetical protein